MKHVLMFVLMLTATAALAQDFAELEFGTNTTFEVMTWNIEWFPKNGQTTVNDVRQIIEALDVDLIAMQELDDRDEFDGMMDELADYVGYHESGYFAGLAYIYNPSTVSVNNIFEIYTSQPYWNAFPRSPVVMDLEFQGERIYVINNHFKCCGDGVLEYGDSGDEEYRRYMASDLLKQYIDNNLADAKVVVLGDLNDILTDSPSNNVFQMFLDDPENYRFADMAIAQGISADWSYPTWPSHLDHILVSNELFEALEHENSTVACLRLDDIYPGGWWDYDGDVSDHRPVAMKLDFSGAVAADLPGPMQVSLSSAPNPFNPRTEISYVLPEGGFVDLSIFDARGRLVEVLVQTSLEAGEHKVAWQAPRRASGLYFARISTGGATSVHKMMLMK